VQSGSDLIVIPRNTAHAWFSKLANATNVPLLDIAELMPGIGLMAKIGPVRAGFFQGYLSCASNN
jgi:aspartate/glutamate racemase